MIAAVRFCRKVSDKEILCLFQIVEIERDMVDVHHCSPNICRYRIKYTGNLQELKDAAYFLSVLSEDAAAHKRDRAQYPGAAERKQNSRRAYRSYTYAKRIHIRRPVQHFGKEINRHCVHDVHAECKRT